MVQDDFQTRAQAEGQAHGAGHVSRPRAHPRSMTPRCTNFFIFEEDFYFDLHKFDQTSSSFDKTTNPLRPEYEPTDPRRRLHGGVLDWGFPPTETFMAEVLDWGYDKTSFLREMHSSLGGHVVGAAQ